MKSNDNLSTSSVKLNKNNRRSMYQNKKLSNSLGISLSKSTTKFLKNLKLNQLKKPPLPKKSLPSTKFMKVDNELQYICRLENNLSLGDIRKRVDFLSDPKLRCNSHSFLEGMRVPKLGIRDVYEKVVYDIVRRDKE